MLRSAASPPTTLAKRCFCASIAVFFLPLFLVANLGCGDSAAKRQAVAVADPEGDFEFGMQRLENALWRFQPSSVGGVRITKRKLDYELFPPTDEKPDFTARVKIVTKASFLHEKRIIAKEAIAKAPKDKNAEIDNPLAEQEAEMAELAPVPGVGPQAPSVSSVKIEPRVLESESVFEMVFVGGRWELTEQPELEVEQLLFQYAFN